MVNASMVDLLHNRGKNSRNRGNPKRVLPLFLPPQYPLLEVRCVPGTEGRVSACPAEISDARNGHDLTGNPVMRGHRLVPGLQKRQGDPRDKRGDPRLVAAQCIVVHDIEDVLLGGEALAGTVPRRYWSGYSA